jgi:hypothetical protein
MHTPLQTFDRRELREFVRSKRVKREPIRVVADGAGRAEYRPRNAQHFARLREQIRLSAHFGKASERIDALERELKTRDIHALPLPRKMIQDEDCSVHLFWNACSVRAFPHGFVYVLQGTHPGQGYARELLEALTITAKMQSL